MRKELELIQLIEQYLLGELSREQAREFETRLQQDATLQQEVTLQRELMEGLDRLAISQSAQKAYRKYKLGKNGLNWGLGGFGLVLIIAAAVWLLIPQGEHSERFSLPAFSANETEMTDPLPNQVFTIQNDQDTVIETQGGIVMVIPANTFVNDNGDPVSGPVELEVKEALEAADIIRAGLSTSAGKDLLETGGMFYLHPQQGGKELNIDPDNGIYVEVPTDVKQPGMQLFQGKELPDGTIDWVDPKPLLNDLIPVDIYSLDFYPPLYVDTLAAMGVDVNDKELVDSIYYSFAYLFEKPQLLDEDTEVYGTYFAVPWNTPLDTMPMESMTSTANDTTSAGPLGINPAKIKAIWNETYQNTLLATREFEQRMPYIHHSCNGKVLDLYVNNLDKPLSEVDRMAVDLLEGKYELQHVFSAFAKRNDGKVTIDNKYADKIKAYYKKKEKAFTQAVYKTQSAFWNEQQALDQQAMNKDYEEYARAQQSYWEELQFNLKEAYQQLGYNWPINNNNAAATLPDNVIAQSWRYERNGIAYQAVVTTVGWKNIDAYVTEATANRQTLNYKNKQGNTVTIEYESLAVEIRDKEQFDRIYAYVVPAELNSFLRMKEDSIQFTEQLNANVYYSLVCIGYKGEKEFLYFAKSINPQTYRIALEPVKTGTLESKLQSIGKAGRPKEILKDLAYQQFKIQDQIRKNRNAKIAKMRDRLARVIFPCRYAFEEESGSRHSELPWIGETLMMIGYDLGLLSRN